MPKSKIEIIEETAAYYSEDTSRRGVLHRDDETTHCVYYNPENGNMCAVGRCLIDPKEFGEGNNIVASSLISSYGVSRFKEDYKISSSVFWTDLQDFHDSDENWDAHGLTYTGQATLDVLKKKYA